MAGPDDLKIGDFSKPVVPRPSAGAPPKEESPMDKRLAAAESAIDKEAAAVEKALGPLEVYEKRLKEIGITREDAAAMVDLLLTQGYWSEEIPITKTLKVRLRTRQYRDTERLRNYMEIVQPKFPDYYNDILFKYSLAASLERLGKESYKHPDKRSSKEDIEQAFQQRLDVVDGLPEPLLRMIYAKLAKFDDKVRIVFEEGAIENF